MFNFPLTSKGKEPYTGFTPNASQHILKHRLAFKIPADQATSKLLPSGTRHEENKKTQANAVGMRW